ncbi:MAG: phenylpropionate dioxygenase-like ring-hydroxylating dioxygenase large terminal subunit [Myxococcota bacterium]|jgi:phenylpropionate dioxygenase-like ring-hydroxylating dioxygenase large terminal subunit
MRQTSGTLSEQWYVACTADELSHDKPLGREILQERLVLYRDPGGRARCFRDRCLHRNAMLSEGFICDGYLACPYHGWRYDSLGRVAHIPSEGPGSKGRPAKKLTAFETREASGLIWVWMGLGEPDERDPFPMPHHDESGWESYIMVTPFENNVTNCVENFMDVPHTITVHAGWFRSDAKKAVRTTVECTTDSVLVTYHQSADSIGFTDLILNPKKEPVTHTDKFFMPNVTRVDYEFGSRRAFVITSQCTPVSPMETMVYTTITFRVERALRRLFKLLLPPYTRRVIEQDVEIMANQGASLKRYGRDFSNAPVDVIHHYIESLRAHAMNGGEGEAPKPASAEVTFFV